MYLLLLLCVFLFGLRFGFWWPLCALINYIYLLTYLFMPSVLWWCWLGGRKGTRRVKTEWWGADVVVSLEQGADLHMAELMPLPLTVSCCSKIQTSFTFLVPAHPGSPGKRAIKRVCVTYLLTQCHTWLWCALIVHWCWWNACWCSSEYAAI